MKTWVKWLIILFILVVIAIVGYSYYLYHSINSAVDKMYVPLKTDTVDTRKEQKPLSNQPLSEGDKTENKPENKPISILLLGIDQREHDKGRSDVLMLLMMNPQNKSTLLFNIPRDTRTEIVNHGTVDKINHAYAFGGVDMSVQTVEKFLQVPIQYYILVNMEGFENIINDLGGVDVQNKLPFNYDEYRFIEGNMHLDGKMALIYSRMRYDDPRGDLGRNDRQQQIIKGLIAKGPGIALSPKLGNVLEELSGTVKTNVTFDEMKKLALEYGSATDRIDNTQIQGNGKLINGIYYYIVSSEERERIHNLAESFMSTSTP